MGIEDLQCIGHSPLFCVYYRAHYGWGRRGKFEMKALIWLENAILGLVFANAVFYRSTILLIFEAEFTESVLDKLSYPESNIKPTLVGPEEKVS